MQHARDPRNKILAIRTSVDRDRGPRIDEQDRSIDVDRSTIEID
jgi:hypothetical protein